MAQRILAGAVVLLVAALPAPAALGASTPRQPNVLVIVTDDQPLGTMDVMSRTRYRFESLGTRFSEAYATTPLCCPSRSSIFSGRFAHNHHVTTNVDPTSLQQAWTIQRYLYDAGYQTALFGRYLNTWNIWDPPPFFHRYSIVGGWDGSYYPYVNTDGTIEHLTDSSYYEVHQVRDLALDFLRSAEANDRRPWLMFLTPKAPHAPYQAEPRYAGASVPPYETTAAFMEADMSDKPEWVQDSAIGSATGPNQRAAQLRTLMSVDDMVDSVLRELGRRGEEKDTLAFFLSDNGLMWGQHRQAGKTQPYTESVKVPFFMRWPGNRRIVRQGATDDRLVANIDIAPTILDAAGAARTAGAPPMDGVSLLDKDTSRERLLLEFFRNGLTASVVPPWAALRTASYQYTEYYEADGATPLRWGDGTPLAEYYDLTTDSIQNVNLLHDGNASNDPNVAALSAQLARDRLCSGASCHPGTQQPPATDTLAPRPLMLFPDPAGAGYTVRGTWGLSGRATDNIGVAGVGFAVDGSPVSPDDPLSPYEGVWDTTASSNGWHTLTATAHDRAGNSAASVPFNVKVDNASPSGVDVQSCVPPSGCGASPGTIENGDSITYSFSAAMEPGTFLSNWGGQPVTVQARVNSDVPAYWHADTLTVPTMPSLGTIDLKQQNFIDFYETASFSTSTIEMATDRRSLKLTLGGGPPPSLPPAFKTDMLWIPEAGLRTAAGTGVCQCMVQESGELDLDF